MRRTIPTLLVVLILLTTATALAEEFSTVPVSNNGKPWRIALYQGGPLRSYQDSLYHMAKSLEQMGWITPGDILQPEDSADTRALWDWLADERNSEFLDFRKDAFYSAEWSPELRDLNRRALIERLNTLYDIDLVIAMGTWAGQDIGTDAHSTPTMVISVSDALGAGIVKSLDDSGLDHLHAFLNPDRYPLQVELFHAIMQFKRLGVVYEDTVEGRSYAAVDKILTVAAEENFTVVHCEAPFSGVSDEDAVANVLSCYQQLAPQIDAMYITVHRGVTLDSINKLLEPLFEFNIPTFSQPASNYVARGALFSLSRANWRFESEFYAKTMAQILNGAKPRSLRQVFRSPPMIAINLATAARIGYEPPLEVLGLADEVYLEIEGEEAKDGLALR